MRKVKQHFATWFFFAECLNIFVRAVEEINSKHAELTHFRTQESNESLLNQTDILPCGFLHGDAKG